jgi:hypothetical protein
MGKHTLQSLCCQEIDSLGSVGEGRICNVNMPCVGECKLNFHSKYIGLFLRSLDFDRDITTAFNFFCFDDDSTLDLFQVRLDEFKEMLAGILFMVK